MIDYSDSAEEARFRQRLQAWLVDHNPHLPSSSTDDAYWAGQAAWHRALYEAGFFGMSWPTSVGGLGLSRVFDAIVDDELAAAGAPPRPGIGYLVTGVMTHGSREIQNRFLPDLISGRSRWCQGFSEPDAGSDLAALRTKAARDGDEYVISGHKVWTSYSYDADWCLVLARTEANVPKHRGISAFIVAMNQPGVSRRPLRMINGIEREFGEVYFEGARVPVANRLGNDGDGWALAMTILSHERQPSELGYAGRYRKTVKELVAAVREGNRVTESARLELAWALVETEMLRHHVARRLDDPMHGPEGSADKLLMTWTEQTVGHAALAIGGAAHDGGDDTLLNVYLYSRAQSVLGGTSQIQRNLLATRVLGLPSQ